MQRPVTRYTKSGDVNIAYQVVGDGPRDLVFTPSFVSHVELLWEEPLVARFLERLATFSRLILFDKRGTGGSDPVPLDAPPTIEERMDDIRAVMDATGSERAALYGSSEGGALCIVFAATYPERTSALVLFAAYARAIRDEEFAEGWATREEAEERIADAERRWGENPIWPAGDDLDDADRQRVARWFGRFTRLAASPGAAAAIYRMATDFDVRDVLPAVRVPTLVMCREQDENAPASRHLAGAIDGARYVELPGSAHAPFFGDQDAVLAEIEAFLTGARPLPRPERILTTVLFTDIVGATEHLDRLGDRRWSDTVSRHHAIVRSQLERYRGRELDNAGDGFFATFDGPARALTCARAVIEQTRDELGIDVRAGVHTGECELVGGKVAGMNVHVGARIAAQAAPGEVLASSTVRDLVAGSGIRFADRGSAALKGVPGEWRLYAMEA